MKNMLTISFPIAAALALSFTLATAPAMGQGSHQALMGDPLPALDALELSWHVDGRDAFEHIFTNAEGLGPVFNDSSCGQCHSTPKAGGFSSKVVHRAGIAGPPFDPLAAKGGSLFQELSITAICQEVIPPEATVFADRLTPPAFGAGLLQSIDDADILDLQNNPPSASVSGIARMTSPFEGGPMRAGKFGWKGGVATMLTFSADALLNENGITNRFVTAENAPNGDMALLAACDTVADPEDGPSGVFNMDLIDRMDIYQLTLAAPYQTPSSGMTGEAIFVSVGCADCHVNQAFVTQNLNHSFLNGVSIKPYGDSLLHDMGSLGDGIVDGIATEQEMKTSPLWGVGARAAVALLHDGRATGGLAEANLDSAIMSHDGEAATSRNAYSASPQSDKDALHAFLMSLGRGLFDIENNNNVDDVDFFFMLQPGMLTGPAPASFTPDTEAAICDVDEDGDLDARDLMSWQTSYSGPNL